MQEAGCVFYMNYFVAVGTSSEIWQGNTDKTVWQRRSELCTRLHASVVPLILLHGLSYICHAAYTHRTAWPRKRKSSMFCQSRRPAGSCPAAGLSCWQDTSAGDTRLGSVSQAGCSVPQGRCRAVEVQRAVEGQEELVLPLVCWHWLVRADGKGLLSDFLAMICGDMLLLNIKMTCYSRCCSVPQQQLCTSKSALYFQGYVYGASAKNLWCSIRAVQDKKQENNNNKQKKDVIWQPWKPNSFHGDC